MEIRGSSEADQREIRGRSEGDQRQIRGRSEGDQREIRGRSEGDQRQIIVLLLCAHLVRLCRPQPLDLLVAPRLEASPLSRA